MIRNVVFGLALGSALTMTQCSSSPERVAGKPGGSPVAVRVGQVEITTHAAGFESIGTVQSRTVTPISAKVMGYVTSVLVREGDRVGKGQLLIEIDPRDAEAQAAQVRAGVEEARQAMEEVEQAILAAESAKEAAAANADLARSTFDRFQTLLERKSVSQQEFDEVSARNQAAQAQLRQSEEMLLSAKARKGQVQSKIQQAEAMLEQAQLFLGYCTVSAPFAGVVSDRRVEVGQLASPGMPLLTLEDARDFQVEAIVSESRVQSVNVGSEVTVEVGSLDQQLQGTVREIVPRADSSSRSFVVKIRVEPVTGLRSGMYATAFFPAAGESTLTVPDSALVRRGQLVGVFVVGPENSARFRLVKTGRSLGDRTEVLAGVAAGDQVVLDPSHDLQDGGPVTLSENRFRPSLGRAPGTGWTASFLDELGVEC